MTMSQFFSTLDGLLRAQSSALCQKIAPFTAMDRRPNVRSSSRLQLRVKEWWSKAHELEKFYEEASESCYDSDGVGGFYVVSTRSRLAGQSIQSLLDGHGASFEKVSVACSRARHTIDTWRESATECHNDIASANNMASALREAWANLRDAILLRDTAFYWLRSTVDDSSTVLARAREIAAVILDDPKSSSEERERALEGLNSNNFLWMGVLSHQCTCPDFWLYGACKHALWATMLSTGQTPPPNLDPRPLATRRSAGRPRRTTSALRPMPTSQEPLV